MEYEQVGIACPECLESNFEFWVLLFRFSLCFHLCPVIYKVGSLGVAPSRKLLLGDRFGGQDGVKDNKKEVTC